MALDTDEQVRIIIHSDPTATPETALLRVSQEPAGLPWPLSLGSSLNFLPRRVVAWAPAPTIHTGAQLLQDRAAKQEIEGETAAPASAPSRSSFR